MNGSKFARRLGLAICLVCLPGLVTAAEQRVARFGRAAKSATPVAAQSAARKAAQPAEQVEMFAAMKSGQIDVKFIPKDDREAKVMITNKTKRPLTVKLPEAFAGVPVLAQRAGGGLANNNMMGGGMNQGMGGGMGMGGGGMGMGGGGMGMGGGGMGGGGGFFNVPAEKVGQFQVATVCLEHGKKNPRPNIPYEIRPIDSFTTKPGVAEMLVQFGYGKVDQRACQAAAWHLNNGMSWQQLAAKRTEHLDGSSEPYFTAEQIAAGMQIAQVAIQAAEERGAQPAPAVSSPGQQAAAVR